jgi:hypothetical protein
MFYEIGTHNEARRIYYASSSNIPTSQQWANLNVEEWTMKATIAILLFIIFGTPALAATFVYVSNADDGQIATYTLQPDGSLKPEQRIKAEKMVMPMAVGQALPHRCRAFEAIPGIQL